MATTRKTGITKRTNPSGKTVFRVRLDVGVDGNGNRLRKSATFATEGAAKAWLVEQSEAVRSGVFADDRNLTYGQWLESWKASLVLAASVGDLRATTADWYRGAVDTHIGPELGGIALRHISPEHIEGFYADRLERGRLRGSGGLSPASVRRLAITVGKSLDAAVAAKLIPANPARSVSVKFKPNKVKAERTWSQAELSGFMAELEGERYRAAFRLAAVTGMRRGEVLGLRWSDVNLDAGRATIAQTLVMVSGQPTYSAPKTPESRRTVAIDAGTVKALKQWKAIQNQERMLQGEAWQETGLVFTREDGSPVRPSHFSRVFGRVAERAGVRPIPLHGLRHTWATWQLGRGRPVHVVSEALGHSSAKVTLDVYATALPSQHDAAVAELAAAIDG